MTQFTFKPITIALSTAFCIELSACEEGSYETSVEEERKHGRSDRPPVAHAHKVATRHANQGYLLITNIAEALDMYYAVCSGVFKAKTPATYKAACRIANTLRPIALVHDASLVKEWPQPDREQFTGL